MKKSVWVNIHLGMVVVWCGVNQMIIHFSKHPFCQVGVILLILFLKSSWCKIESAARNLINSLPQALQAAATTFAFSSVYILIL